MQQVILSVLLLVARSQGAWLEIPEYSKWRLGKIPQILFSYPVWLLCTVLYMQAGGLLPCPPQQPEAADPVLGLGLGRAMGLLGLPWLPCCW